MSEMIADHHRNLGSVGKIEKKRSRFSRFQSRTIPDDRGCLRFRVFISRLKLGRSGNSGIPDRLGFSRHMKTGLCRWKLISSRRDSCSWPFVAQSLRRLHEGTWAVGEVILTILRMWYKSCILSWNQYFRKRLEWRSRKLMVKSCTHGCNLIL